MQIAPVSFVKSLASVTSLHQKKKIWHAKGRKKLAEDIAAKMSHPVETAMTPDEYEDIVFSSMQPSTNGAIANSC